MFVLNVSPTWAELLIISLQLKVYSQSSSVISSHHPHYFETHKYQTRVVSEFARRTKRGADFKRENKAAKIRVRSFSLFILLCHNFSQCSFCWERERERERESEWVSLAMITSTTSFIEFLFFLISLECRVVILTHKWFHQTIWLQKLKWKCRYRSNHILRTEWYLDRRVTIFAKFSIRCWWVSVPNALRARSQ